MQETQIVVLGGGAAGMMAALTASTEGTSVLLIEPNDKLGRKLYITGKGRCNLANDCTPAEVLQHVPHNAKFLHSAVQHFPPSEVKAFFEGLGVKLKTERGGRVFPQSDKAADVIDALFFALKRRRVKIAKARCVEILTKEGQVTGIKTQTGQVFPAKAVIVATGGVSYPRTGSTGDGYALAQALGHSIAPLQPSLVPLVEDGTLCSRMQGLSLKNVKLTIKNQKKKVLYEEQGELLFTHFGLSGPLVLTASCHLRNFDKDSYTAILDLKPALDETQLEQRLLRDLDEQKNRSMQHVLEGLLPRLLIPVMLDVCAIPPQCKVHDLTKAQRRRLQEQLKQFRLPIASPRPIEEGIVTAGGVSVREVNPNTMMSKKAAGLFFAGEVLDVDAYTGGFNLQIAWCTGHLAGVSAAQYDPV